MKKLAAQKRSLYYGSPHLAFSSQFLAALLERQFINIQGNL
ncbi:MULTISPECIES: hypothetical protein [Nostocales]|uniref:Transposase n=2 Tax=Nostocales TaxID=1161 RepID=A0ABW8WXB9_9CYAN|nr:hypothetical protein [Tolypothrix bouteillei]